MSLAEQFLYIFSWLVQNGCMKSESSLMVLSFCHVLLRTCLLGVWDGYKCLKKVWDTLCLSEVSIYFKYLLKVWTLNSRNGPLFQCTTSTRIYSSLYWYSLTSSWCREMLIFGICLWYVYICMDLYTALLFSLPELNWYTVFSRKMLNFIKSLSIIMAYSKVL